MGDESDECYDIKGVEEYIEVRVEVGKEC